VGISCFFLQAEEGLRVFHVTGVQACALPIWLAHDDDLAPADVEAITRRLDRLDRASAIGPWTRQTLELIAAHPERRAPDLAAMVGRERDPFKLDVRKLKGLGLTLSFPVGYRVSPRGEAYLAHLAATRDPS